MMVQQYRRLGCNDPEHPHRAFMEDDIRHSEEILGIKMRGVPDCATKRQRSATNVHPGSIASKNSLM